MISYCMFLQYYIEFHNIRLKDNIIYGYGEAGEEGISDIGKISCLMK